MQYVGLLSTTQNNTKNFFPITFWLILFSSIVTKFKSLLTWIYIIYIQSLWNYKDTPATVVSLLNYAFPEYSGPTFWYFQFWVSHISHDININHLKTRMEVLAPEVWEAQGQATVTIHYTMSRKLIITREGYFQHSTFCLFSTFS